MSYRTTKSTFVVIFSTRQKSSVFFYHKVIQLPGNRKSKVKVFNEPKEHPVISAHIYVSEFFLLIFSLFDKDIIPRD